MVVLVGFGRTSLRSTGGSPRVERHFPSYRRGYGRRPPDEIHCFRSVFRRDTGWSEGKVSHRQGLSRRTSIQPL